MNCPIPDAFHRILRCHRPGQSDPGRVLPRAGLAVALIASAVLAQTAPLAAQQLPAPVPQVAAETTEPPGLGGIGLIEAPEGRLTARPGAGMNLLPGEASPAQPSRDRAGGMQPKPLAANDVLPPLPPAGAPPVVVELFTAQGCSSCPPADAMMAALAERDDVLPLAWHVDYWDYLGWTDEFARPEHTERQRAYAEVAGEHAIYTPQIIVDGQDTLITAHPAGLLALIEDHAAYPPAISVTARPEATGFVLDLMPRAAIPGGVAVMLVRYAPQRQVTIRAGENRGRTMTYINIVLDSRELTHWDARTPLRLNVSRGSEPDGTFAADTRHAILAQQRLPGELPGPILTAVRLD